VVLDLASGSDVARDLQAGGVFVPGYDLPLNAECELVLRGAGANELRIPAFVVWSQGGGVGLQLHGFDGAMKQRIAAFAASASSGAITAQDHAYPMQNETGAEPDAEAGVEPDPEPDEPDAERDEPSAEPAAERGAEPEGAKRPPAGLNERLRGLTVAQQTKVAAPGELGERVMLERIYGKSVWEALLRNPRLTGPEVARIARMGTLPRPQMETILNNGGWLQIPEVRRALLTNPRLGADQVLRILRLLPKHEIKLAAQQTAYPLGVRTAAKSLLKEQGGG